MWPRDLDREHGWVHALFGIAVRNGILLVRHYNDLMHEGAPIEEAIRRGSMERLVPILMTALTALACSRIVIAAGEPVSNSAPLSVVVLGGLLSSTFLERARRACRILP